ncbi:glycosyltransferase [Candidatus Pelagibacter sp.]|nr:glycosyltransferase [Candidatus Pelagibacter sp.]
MKINNKVKLFVFQPYPKFGGDDRSIIKLINGLNYSDITIISILKCPYTKYLNKKIKFKQLKSKRVLFSIYELRSYIKKELLNIKSKKNIIISNQNFANVATILAFKDVNNIKTILIERNHLDELKNYNGMLDFLKKLIISSLIKIFYKNSDAIVGISKKLSKDLKSFINNKVHTIYNPSLEDQIIRNNDVKPIQIQNLKKIILTVGFLEKQKDHITILKAINILKKKHKNFILILIGRGTQLNKLQNYIKTNNLKNYVKIYQNINNASQFYKVADLFILSSIYEGLGNVVVEALKHKCPVITSNCNAGPMEIINYGKYGDFFQVRDFKVLSNKIANHLKNPERLKQKSISAKKYINKFSLEQNIKKFNELFSKI